jgi:heme A synthase
MILVSMVGIIGPKGMKRSEKIDWILRIAVFGSALVVGIIGAWNVWASLRDYTALLLFVFAFIILFSLMVYLIRRRKLGMLETK